METAPYFNPDAVGTKSHHRICDLNCDHKITFIPKGDKDNPYKTDLYVCEVCLKEFRKALMEREFIVQQFGENCTVETTNCGLTMSPEREGFDVLYQIAVLKPTVLDSPLDNRVAKSLQ